MYRRHWIQYLVAVELCFTIITKAETEEEKVEEAVDGREIGRGTTFPGSDDAVFEKLGITSLRNEILEGPPSGESSPKSIRKELKANENEEQWDSEEGKAEASSTVPSSHLLGSFDHSSDAKRTEESVSEKSESGGGGERGNWPRKKAEQEESVLLRVLMDGYEKDVRPVRNASQPILIEVGITLTQIFDMDEKNQVLTTTVWLDQEWYDEMLTWEPADFNNMTSIRLPCHKIWLPDIVLYNSADDYTRGYFASRAMVNHDGKIFWPPPTKFRSTCPVDVTYFPFDDQICKLKLGSWTYNGFQVDVTNRTTEVDLSNYISSGEWELLGAELQRNVVYYSCCPEPFPDVTITLIIRRKTLFYVFNVIIPCILLSFLTLLVFFLPPDSGEKVALGITVLLAFSVFMLAIAEKMPETSESIPLIGIYLTAVMIITSISVVVTVIVLNLHYLGPRVSAVPGWLRYLLPNEDKEFILLQKNEISSTFPLQYEHEHGRGKRNQVLISHHQEQLGRCSAPSVKTCFNSPPQIHSVLDNTADPTPPSTFDEDFNNESDAGESHNLRNRRPDHNHRNAQPTMLTDTSTSSNHAHTAACAPEIQDELVSSIRYLIQKQKESERQQNLVSEWRLAAQVVDRILFWVFFVITLVSSGIFLLILPLYKRSWNGPTPPAYS